MNASEYKGQQRNRLIAPIKSHGMIGRRKDDALHAGAMRGLEQIIAADDVGVEDRVPWGLDRNAAQMDDAVNSVYNLLDLRVFVKIRADEVFTGPKIVRDPDVAEP